MNRELFWLSDDQFERIFPHLPSDTRDKPRVDGCFTLCHRRPMHRRTC